MIRRAFVLLNWLWGLFVLTKIKTVTHLPFFPVPEFQISYVNFIIFCTCMLNTQNWNPGPSTN